MTQGAFYQPKGNSPTALTMVVLLHGAAIAALALSKMDVAFTPPVRTDIDWITEAPPAPPNPDEPVKRNIEPPVKDRVFIPQREIEATPSEDMFSSTTQTLEEVKIIPDPGPAIDEKPYVEPVRVEPRKLQSARAKANLASYVSDADYPASAMRGGAEGTTHFTLNVGADGRVTGCTVTASSGSSALDAATCKIMRSRARFQPARDADGRPTTDSVSNRIRWVLPDE
jgi:protein TonB